MRTYRSIFSSLEPTDVYNLLIHHAFHLFHAAAPDSPPPFLAIFPTTMARDIRSRALEKIAALSASKPTALFEKSDLDRLCRACSSHARSKSVTNGSSSIKSQPLGGVPMVSRLVFTVIVIIAVPNS